MTAGTGRARKPRPVPAEAPTLTLERWLREPDAVVREAFAEGGPVDAVMREGGRAYHAEPAQVGMAALCARSMAAGASDGDGPICNFQQASTGVGKGLAYGVPLMLHAALTGRRCVVATHTVALQRQWLASEGPRAAAVARLMTGHAPTFALRRSRRHFASPSRLAGQAAMLAEADDGASEAKATLRQAVDSLLAWTKAALATASALPDGDAAARGAFAASFAGLVDVWREGNPDLAAALDELPPERYALTGSSPPGEQAAYRAYAAAAADARVVIVTMAALVVDLNLWGRVLDPDKAGYGAVVVDEADKLPEVAHDLFAVKHSVGGMASCFHDVLEANRKTASAGLALICREGLDAVEAAVTALRARAHGPARGKDRIDLSARDAVVPLLEEIVRTYEATLDAIDGLAAPAKAAFHEAYEDVVERMGELSGFIKAIRADVDAREGKPQVSFSPLRDDPSLVLVPMKERMVLARLWGGPKPRTRSVTFTSATLASPGAAKGAEFMEMVEDMGLSNRRDLVADGLNALHAPARFGTHAYRLAHPRAPIPGASPFDGDGNPDAWARYVAHAVSLASGLPGRKGACRKLVLTTSFDAAEAVAAACVSAGVSAGVPSVRARARGEALERCLGWFRETPDATLVTPGAWEGVDMPGLVDHVMVTRLPYEPWGPPFFRVSGGAFKGVSRMLRRLRQAIGRGVRQRDDDVTVWLLDPRFGTPSDVLEEHHQRTGVLLLPRRTRMNVDCFACVEDRFRKALDAAELVDLPPGMAFDIQPARREEGEGE